MKVYGVVYLIINMINGKRYVGQTTQSLEKRFKQHACVDSAIGEAIRKYGKKNFRYGIIKSCASKDELNRAEMFFIAALKSKVPYGYNMTDGGEGGNGALGIKRSPETCAKIAAAKIGANNPNYGKPLTDECRAKISASLTGKKKNIDFNGEKNPFFGKHHTTSTRTKLSAIRCGDSPFKTLVAELDAHQFSHTILAQLMGISRRLLSRKIRGERNFTVKDKMKLEEIFGKPAEYLLQRDGE